MDVKDKIITADAMHCQRETCRRIVDGQGAYVFGLKEDQPSLLEDVRLFFETCGSHSELECSRTVEKNAGRIEKRICRKIKDISWLEAHKWPGLKSVFSIERVAEVRGRRTCQTGFYISSLDVSAAQLMAFVREHWKIESFYWLLDVTFSEDNCRFLSEDAHITMNVFCKFALAVHKNFLAANSKKSSLKASMLSALLNPDAFIDILLFL